MIYSCRPYRHRFQQGPLGLLVLILTLFVNLSAKSQVYPVQASLAISPPYSVYLSDYASPGSTRFMTSLYFADLSKPSVNVRFRIKIEGVGIEIKTKESFIGSMLALPSGIPEVIYGDQLSEYFRLENLDFSGLSKEDFARTGALPEGVYRFTIEVLEYNRGVRISNEASTTAWLVLNDPPMLNLPANAKEITSIEPQVVRFQWTPRHKGSPNSSFTTEYKLQIFEIWPETRNRYDAVNTMNPVFETVTANNYFVYSIAYPQLITGRLYAWQVQAIPNTGAEQLDLFKNNGFSEVKTFRFGQVCNPPESLTLAAAHNRELALEWPTTLNATAFTVMYREQVDNGFWYENLSYLPSDKITRLQPGRTYEVQVISHCGLQRSEPSQPFAFTTTDAQNDFVCMPVDFQPDLDNTVPIDWLYSGDIIMAGDFEIELIEVYNRYNTYSGYGLARFPFLQQLSAQVIFENIRVNTEKRVFEGHITTIYDESSRYFKDLDGSDQIPGLSDNDVSVSEGNDISDSTSIENNYTVVDSIFVSEAGEIIVVVDGEQTTVSNEQLANGEQYQDANGTTIAAGADGTPVVNQANSANKPAVASNQQAQNASNTYDFDFGPLKIKITEEPNPTINEENCEYSNVNVEVDLLLEDLEKGIKQNFKLESAVFSYTRDCSTGELLSGRLRWDNSLGSKSITLLDIQADLIELSIEIDKDGIAEGKLIFEAGLEADKSIGGLMVLKQGLSGEFSFTMNRESDDLMSSFDFDGIENITLEMVKQQKVLARLGDGFLDSEGRLKGKFLLAEEVGFATGGFNLVLKRLNLDIIYRLGKELQIVDGNFRMLVSDIELVQGELVVNGNYIDGILQTEVTSKDLKSFGMELSDLNLMIDLDATFGVSKIEGSVSAEHPEFGVVLDVNQFSVVDGKLEEFNFSGDLNREGLQVNVQEAQIEPLEGYLNISAIVEVEHSGVYVAAELSDFLIYSDGTVQWGDYDLNFDGTRTFGPLTVAIKGESVEKSGTWRKTTAEASMILEIEGLKEPLTITGAQINYEKHRRKDQYRNVAISVAEANIKAELGFIDTYLTEIDIYLDSGDEVINGDGSNASVVKITEDSYINFNIDLKEDVSLGKLVYLKEGLSGFLDYSFNGDGLGGTLGYEDINNLEIELRKNESVLARLSESDITSDGLLTGKLTALEGSSFEVNGFALHVDQMEYDIRLPLQQGISAFAVLSGRGALTMEGKGSLNGALTIDYSLDELGNVQGYVANSTTLSAFGMALSDFELAVDLNNNLDFQRIEGSLEAKHEKFNSALAVNNFLIENGQLMSFDLQGEVVYNGFNLKLANAEFVDDALNISGEVAIDVAGTAAWLAVEELRLLANGEVLINGVAGELDKSPVYVSFMANLDDSRFKGEFRGELSGIGLSGAIDLGVASDAYQFAYLELAAQGNVPLAGSGLKLTELGGQLGYNYRLVYGKDGIDPEGNPQEDNYVVGLLLGVADMANIVEVKGNSVAQFGQEQFELTLNGSLSIPKENAIAKGEVNLNYLMPDNTLDGNVNIDLNVPPASGSVLKANFDMNYAYAAKDWTLSSTDISAALFGEVEFTGNIDLQGSEDSPVEGVMSGQAAYAFSYNKEFRALATTFRAKLDAGFNFDGDIAFDQAGVSGQTYLLVYANGELGVVSDIGDYSTLLAVSGASEALLEFNSDAAKLSGNLIVAISVLGFEHDVTVEIDKQI